LVIAGISPLGHAATQFFGKEKGGADKKIPAE